MYKAKKENKTYKIDESMIKQYSDMGYDIYKDGKLYKRSPKTKVSYQEYEELLKENEQLKAEIVELKKGAGDEFESMTVEELKAYAETNGIDIGNATSKDGITKKIKASLNE